MDAFLVEIIKSRYKCNKEILNILADLIEEYPDWRFHQLLQNVRIEDFSDRFYEESRETLKRLKSNDIVINNVNRNS